ncbi:MAG: TaqI family restriction endonuclease [Rickettsiales bacterium]|jgi:hypothetical protein|nr:TaqI family restriction endonuclease [Rickettsiales bacterium]
MTRFTHQQFTDFCKTIDLQYYRERYSKIKIVEMDLPPSIHALDTIYENYWDNANDLDFPPSYEEYYDIYYNRHKAKIKEFWKITGFGLDCDCFKNGLEARIYRTWASLITQIHAGYVAESVFGIGNIEMSTKLDHEGIDILVHYKDIDIKIQVKKDTARREIARMDRASKGDIIDIYYVVPSDYDIPYYSIKSKQGQLRPWANEFVKFNPDGTMDRLDNGFVIFVKKVFEDIIQAD